MLRFELSPPSSWRQVITHPSTIVIIIFFVSSFTAVQSASIKSNNPKSLLSDSGSEDDFLSHEAPPGLGYFEEWERQIVKNPTITSLSKSTSEINVSPSIRQDSFPDVRVSRAIGSRGYDKVRLSVVSTILHNDGDGDEDDDNSQPLDFFVDTQTNKIVNFTHHEKFRHKWKSAFDLGRSKVSCSKPYRIIKNDNFRKRTQHNLTDGSCLEACTNDSKCKFYTYFPGKKKLPLKSSSHPRCELSSYCDYVPNETAEATYAKAGDWFLRSAVVTVKPDIDNIFLVDDQEITVRIPSQHEGTKGIIISDPCFSKRWIQCKHGQEWDTYSRTIEMMNALAKDPDLHFFQMLGDNFYDQDGRLTKVLYDALSLEVKSKILVTVPGNHDIWVCGGPDCSDQYDQYGIGFMQYYAQDTIFSTHSRSKQKENPELFLNFSDGLDMQSMDTDPANFFQYHMIGNLGFIGYTGASSFEEVESYFEEACNYMADQAPSFIFLLGHWNGHNRGCQTGMSVPEVHKRIQSLHGCNVEDRIKYFDGHKHQNKIQEMGQKEEVGFMIGGHGMHTIGTNQYGFAYIDSTTRGRLKIYYFEERNTKEDHYEDILNCAKSHGGGLDNCVHLADLWLDTVFFGSNEEQMETQNGLKGIGFDVGDWISNK